MEPIPLLTPYRMGQLELSHRVVLAPLTRQRAYGGLPQPHVGLYYSQRATSGGLLISEATAVSPDVAARGFRDVPGIWTDEHVGAWRPVVDAVHAKGAVFFCQLWHAGRRPVELRADEEMQISPQMGFYGRLDDLASPRRLTAEEIPRVVDSFRKAARNAVEAGFDGVEILGLNGYFVDDEREHSSASSDYVGGVENRCRFAVEVVDAVAREVGVHRVGVRLDQISAGDSSSSGSDPLALHLVSRLSERGILYCHMIEPRLDADGARQRRVQANAGGGRLLPFREAFKGTFIATGGYGREEGNKAVGEGHADLVAFGRLFLANPDLPRRFELGAPLNKYNRATFYAAADHVAGYTDYPFLC